MARVRLYLWQDSGNQVFQFVRSGLRASIVAVRLRAFVNLVPLVRPGGAEAAGAAHPWCIIDTGSPLSIVPEYIWSHFRPGVVTRLPFDPAMPPHFRRVSVGNGNYPYELGDFPIRLWDQNQRTLDVRVIAKFTRDNGRLTLPMTLGLRGGAIDGRILRSEPDTTASFGQAWWLEDP